MNTAAISALSALGGSAIGAVAPVLTNVLVQRSAARLDLANRTVASREALYSDFINEASRLFVASVTHNLENLTDLVALYALVSRIRLGATDLVLHAAEDVVKRITEHFGEANLPIEQVARDVVSGKGDPLGTFSFACRKELNDIVRVGL